MKTFAVLTATAVTEADLRSLVVELDGTWIEDAWVHQGSIFRDGGQIILRLENDAINDWDEGDTPPGPNALMGLPPKSQIVIGVIRYHDAELDRATRALAIDVAELLSKKWRGCIDWGDIPPPSATAGLPSSAEAASDRPLG